MNRFLLGSVTTAVLGLVPYSAIVAVGVWMFGADEPKFGPLMTWMLATLLAGVIGLGGLLGFVLSYPLLRRVTRHRSTLHYVIVVAVQVGLMYLFLLLGFASWMGGVIEAESPPGIAAVLGLTGVLAYLGGVVLTAGGAIIPAIWGRRGT